MYLDSMGRPASLPMTGSEPCFVKLVASVSTDIPPGAMRAELIRSGTALDVDGYVVLNKRHVVPESVDGKIITALAFNFRGLAATIAHNSNPRRTEPGWIERFVHSGPLGMELVAQVRDEFRTKIQRFSEEIDDNFGELEHARARSVPRGKTRRMGMGIYYTEDDFD
jgi:hypothetical protein